MKKIKVKIFLVLLGCCYFFPNIGLAQEADNAQKSAQSEDPKGPDPETEEAAKKGMSVEDLTKKVEGLTLEKNADKIIEEFKKYCGEPDTSSWKEIVGIGADITAMAATYAAGTSSSASMAGMCALGNLLTQIANSANQGQSNTCKNGIQVCDSFAKSEQKAIDAEENQCEKTYIDLIQIQQCKGGYAERRGIVQAGNKACKQELTTQSQQHTAQAGSNANSLMQGLQNCVSQLSSGEESSYATVDCSLSTYQSHPSCLQNKTSGDTIGQSTRGSFGSTDEDGVLDDPVEDERSYSAADQNAGSPTGSSGGLGFLGSGSNSGTGNTGTGSGGVAKKTGAGSLYGNDSGGGSAWNMANGNSSGGLSRFASKKSGVKIPTQRKLAGQKLGAGSEFGASTDDIWTRVYLRTNTRCTKQLLECSANKSLNPYGRN